MSRGELRTLTLASLGGALEFYDFVVFVFFVSAIGTLFFPPTMPDWLRQAQTFAIFAAGYLARPLGGVIMAHFGDTSGRKQVFMLSVLMMAVPTLLIGLLPTYRSIGIAAPLLLLLLRMLQGASIGGEAPAGWVFVAEHAPPGRVGLACGMLTGGLTGGILLGSLVATTIQLTMPQAALLRGGWRIAFLLGGVLGLLATTLRSRLHETPVFEALRAQNATAGGLPVRAVLREHLGDVMVCMVATWMLTAVIVVVILMAPTLLRSIPGLPAQRSMLAGLAATATLTFSVVLAGAAVDRWGVVRTAIPWTLLLIASTYALFAGARAAPYWLVAFGALAGAGAGVVSLVPVVMVRAFPAPVRFSGISLSYNLAYALFGGITPPLVSLLYRGRRLGPAHYVALAACCGLLAIVLASRIHKPDRSGAGASRRRLAVRL